MIETIIASDEKDSEMGDFFHSCSENLNDYFHEKEIEVIFLKSGMLNEASIDFITKPLTKFIFAAYSHGGDCELLQGGLYPYISGTININNFSNSFFYTCSCHTAKELGTKLIENGCLSFIGYNGKFTIWDFYREPFIECANWGIKLFYDGDKSEDIIIKMKDRYTMYIDNYQNDIFGAAMLVSNRNALIHVGRNISINDLV